MKKAGIIFYIVIILFSITPAQAQDNLIIRDGSGLLDQAAIQTAAQPLLDNGAIVAVYLIPEGSSADVLPRLQSDGLAQGTSLRKKLIVIYFATNPHYSEIRYEDSWQDELGNNYIREDLMNPALRSGDYTGAVTQSLASINQKIEGGSFTIPDAVIFALFCLLSLIILVPGLIIITYLRALRAGYPIFSRRGGINLNYLFRSRPHDDWDNWSSFSGDSSSSDDFGGSGDFDGGDW